VDRLVADRGWELDAAVGALLGRWPDVVGPDVAAHAEPEGLADGILTIRAASTAWAVQLRELAPTLRARVDAELGAGVCRRISVLGPAAPSWRRGRLSVRGRGPRDTYG
jgi:predicted nucleic acid-binding Zn ribbon protein